MSFKCLARCFLNLSTLFPVLQQTGQLNKNQNTEFANKNGQIMWKFGNVIVIPTKKPRYLKSCGYKCVTT